MLFMSFVVKNLFSLSLKEEVHREEHEGAEEEKHSSHCFTFVVKIPIFNHGIGEDFNHSRPTGDRLPGGSPQG